MRASDLWQKSTPANQRALAARLKVDGADPLSVLNAMRSPDIFERLERACTSAVMREDVVLLCANPFDRVAPDELVDPAKLEALGLIALVGDDYAVNIDMALASVPSVPVEFGYSATLLARLAPNERTTVAKAMKVGPRPSVADQILDIAEAMADSATLMTHVAHLRESERKVIHEALELGELPDDLTDFPLDSPPPNVTLDPGAAGQRGIVFWIEHEESDLESRPVVPIELMRLLPPMLASVPPPPEVVAAKAPRKRAPAAPRRTPRAELLSNSDIEPLRPSDARSDSSGTLRPLRDPLSASGFGTPGTPGERADARSSSGAVTAFAETRPVAGASTPTWVGRVSAITPASAIVELPSTRAAEAALKDEELAKSIAEVIGDGLVVLRPGVDVRDWAERCALRLGL